MIKRLFTSIWFLFVVSPTYSQVLQNSPFDLSQTGPNGQRLDFNTRIAVPSGNEEVRMEAMLGAPVPCSEVTFEYEVVEEKRQFSGTPNVFGQPRKICFGGSGSVCTGTFKDSTPVAAKPDRVYDWQVRVRSTFYQQGASCGTQTGTATSNWLKPPAIYAFGTAPNWYTTSARLGETAPVCGIEAYDQDPSYFHWPPDGKFAGFKMLTRQGCDPHTFVLSWPAYVVNKRRAKDGYFFAHFKADRKCTGTFAIHDDDVPDSKLIVSQFTLQPNVIKKIGIKIGHDPDPSKDRDFITYVQRSSQSDFVGITFTCKSDADFQVFFDTVAVAYGTQNYAEDAKIIRIDPQQLLLLGKE